MSMSIEPRHARPKAVTEPDLFTCLSQAPKTMHHAKPQHWSTADQLQLASVSNPLIPYSRRSASPLLNASKPNNTPPNFNGRLARLKGD